MALHKRYTTLQLIGRSLLPSWGSGILCVGFGGVLIAIHCLLLSISAGTALPNLLDGQWATFYTNLIVRPIDVLFGNLVFNSIVSMLLWGAGGLVVYSVAEFIFHLVRDGRAATHDVQLAGQYLVRHPARHEYIVRLIWRASVLMIAFAFVVVVHAVPQSLLVTDAKLVAGVFSLTESVRQLAFSLMCWTVLAHFLVVFLRLFLMRTRLFGDELIE